ncbi:redoxin domain-containing protein [Microbacterium aurantiacum]|uniref:redoxin domain-containing protein n=1 Tax=Microbacterium aurantiacum TaxID=162393 RepID=UPI0015E0D306|nr:redoxin domain-containing protein [Microbacterium aurantiacum]
MSDAHTIVVPAIGAFLPDFRVVDSADAMSSLAERTRGDGSTVVFFMRASTCPICRAHVRTLEAMAESGELGGARVVVVTPGGAAEARAVARSTTLDVFGSGDHHRDVGLGRFLTLQHSGTFVLDASGRVLARRASALPTASFSRKDIRETLARTH